MKTSVTFSWCAFLLLSWVSISGAQQQPPATPPASAPAGQTPQNPPQNPSQTPPENPAQNPPEQAPLAQPRTGIRQPPPPVPKVPDIRMPGETGYWVGINGWIPSQTPTIDKGKASAFTAAALTKLQGKSKVTEGAEVGLALGLHNAIRFTYFQSKASGNLYNTYETQLWSKDFPNTAYVSTNYKLQNFKLSFDYLTYPYPVESRRFRLKTLWQLQYTTVDSVFDQPLLPLVDDNGIPLADASGNPLSYAAGGKVKLLTPSFGLGVSEYVTKNFRLEANAAGFGVPHHYNTWDADASANFRAGHFELKIGAKAFHYRTSTKAEYYMFQTMGSAFVGLRWYSD